MNARERRERDRSGHASDPEPRQGPAPRRDSGTWELPGGCVEVGESALDAAVRETTEEAGVRVQIVGLVGLFTDPAHVVRSASGEIWGRPRPDLAETVEAAKPAVRRWVQQVLYGGPSPVSAERPAPSWVGQFDDCRAGSS